MNTHTETVSPEVKSGEVRRGLPFLAVLGLLVGLMIFATSTTALRDIDLFWHLLAGKELAAGVPPSALGQDWNLTSASQPWTTTQWLSEWLLFQLHSVGGWYALAALRVVTAATAIGILAQTTLRGRNAALAGLPFIVAAIAIALASQERPQQATLIGAAVLGGTLVRGLSAGRLPRWFFLVPATTLWANLHGGWVLAPAMLALVAVGRMLDHGPRDRIAHRGFALAALAGCAGLLSPAGPYGLTAVFSFSRSASLIREWQAVQPTHGLGVLTLLMLAMIAIGWSRSNDVPRSEVLTAFACLVFSWLAWRNIAPGLALLAPLVAQRLELAFPTVRWTEPRWSRPVGMGLAVALTGIGLLGMVGRTHLPIDTQPIKLAALISDMPTGQRVLNHYNVAGDVLYFGGAGTRVGIDGRSDMYGADYIRAYLDLQDLSGDWKTLLAELDPTVALIKDDTALVHVLTEERGWEVLGRDNEWILLGDGNRDSDPQ